MIRHHEEVQRPLQARTHTGARCDLLAPREPIGLLGSQPVAEHTGIRRIGRVQVRVTEIDAVRVTPVEIRRVFLLPSAAFSLSSIMS